MKRMKGDEGRMIEGDDEVLKVMAKHWKELGKKRDRMLQHLKQR